MPVNMVFVDNVTVIPADWLNNVNAFVNSGAGAGTVTNVLFSASNGFSASIANSTTVPNITVSCTVSGILKGNGTGLSTAAAGVDYLVPPNGTALVRANNAGALAAAVPGQDYLPGTATLVTGLLKSTNGTGALSIAQNTDLPAMSATQGGAVPTPPNNTLYFLRGDGTWGIPAGGGGGGGGSVTSVTGTTANGFVVAVANPTTTPNVTVSCNVTGILKAAGGTVTAAIAGADFGPSTSGLATGIVKSTTGSGAHTIAVAADFPTLNQNTTGTAAGLSATLAVGSGGTGVTTSTGSGSNVLSNSPALITPLADGLAVGYKNIPQNSQSVNYTAVLGDSSWHLFHPGSDTTARTFTIPSNASVAYPIGTVLTFVNQHSAGILTIAINSDTMRLAGTGTTGSRTLAADGVAEALKITATEWIINGTGLT